jgi:hypothetical protein
MGYLEYYRKACEMIRCKPEASLDAKKPDSRSFQALTLEPCGPEVMALKTRSGHDANAVPRNELQCACFATGRKVVSFWTQRRINS